MKNLIRFDWAVKRLLRNKTNFGILEGFLSELTGEDIKIESILESETNKDYKEDKLTRVDLLVKNTKGELIIIEKEEIKDEFKAKGLEQAKKELNILKLSEKDRKDYEHFIEQIRYEESIIVSNYKVGELKGIEEERTRQEEKQYLEKLELARIMIKDKEPIEKIMKYT